MPCCSCRMAISCDAMQSDMNAASRPYRHETSSGQLSSLRLRASFNPRILRGPKGLAIEHCSHTTGRWSKTSQRWCSFLQAQMLVHTQQGCLELLAIKTAANKRCTLRLLKKLIGTWTDTITKATNFSLHESLRLPRPGSFQGFDENGNHWWMLCVVQRLVCRMQPAAGKVASNIWISTLSCGKTLLRVRLEHPQLTVNQR